MATNAILEHKGARLAYVTTKGFWDILFLQRHDRRNIYDLRYAKPVPPVERRDCFEVDERVSASGQVVWSQLKWSVNTNHIYLLASVIGVQHQQLNRLK